MIPWTRHRIGRNLSGGLLWSLIVSAAEVGFMPATQIWLAPAVITFMWCVSGLVFAMADLVLAPRLSTRGLVLVMVALSVPLAGMQMVGVSLAGAMAGVEPPSPDATFLHSLWLYLTFGGLALTALVLTRRTARTQAVLSQAVVAARQSEARLREAAARDLRGQMQPERLVSLIAELEQRYALDRAAGDRLLERMTDFLRAAMPSVRSGGSTLAGELATIGAYGRLMSELEPARGAWPVRLAGPAPDMAFPPLVLLPTLDALSAATGAGVEVRLVEEPQGLRLQLLTGKAHAGPWLDEDLERRLRLSLRTTLGQSAILSVGAEGRAHDTMLDIRLPTPAPALPAEAPTRRQPPQRRTHHG